MNETDWLSKRLILFSGKGGVGKTTIAEAAARYLASKGRRTLLCHVLQLGEVEQRMDNIAPDLWSTTLRASDCFREYIILKLKLKPLYTAFLGNKLTQYLERAAPGIREIVLMGKLWHERQNFDHVVVDMPSTGYALTMIHTPFNFASLFPGGPIYNDSKEMIATLCDPAQTALVTVSLAEEMPVQESIELAFQLKKIMPENLSYLILNRLTRVEPAARELHARRFAGLSTAERASPLWQGLDYLVTRERMQKEIIKTLEDGWAPYHKPWYELDEVPSPDDLRRTKAIAERIATTSRGGSLNVV